MIEVVVVDDHPMFRAGLIQAISAEGDIAVLGEGSSAAEAVALAGSLRPDILLLDSCMSDSGVERVGDVIAACPEIRVIMVTADDDENNVAQALQAGVSGYVLKGATGPEMRSILRSVNAGESYVPSGMMGRLLSKIRTPAAAKPAGEPQGTLSHQETQVLQTLALGLSNREIGEKLGISERTVKFHLSNIFPKLHVRNRVEACIVAQRMSPGEVA